jgi:hypothetical protein
MEHTGVTGVVLHLRERLIWPLSFSFSLKESGITETPFGGDALELDVICWSCRVFPVIFGF